MANSVALSDTPPIYFGGVGPVYEYELNIDTPDTDVTVRTGTTKNRIIVVGLLLNQNTSAKVTLKSGNGKARSFSLVLDEPRSGNLYLCKTAEDLKLRSSTTSTSLIVQVAEVDAARLNAALSMGNDVGAVTVAPPINIRHGQLSVGTSQVQITAGSLTQGVTVKAPSTNTGKLYVGVAGVTASTGYPLSAGEQVFLACDNANRVFVISDAASQAVSWLGS